MNSEALGYHGIWDVHGCNPATIELRPSVERCMDALVASLNLTKIGDCFKQFEPVGVTGIYLLSESHLSVHTWPERGYAAIDIFSCLPFEDGQVEMILKEHFGAQSVVSQSMERGAVAVEVQDS